MKAFPKSGKLKMNLKKIKKLNVSQWLENEDLIITT
jgi:hypothetical protein